MINNLRKMIEYSLTNSKKIANCKNPKLYLMGFSAGASTIAAVSAEYSEVEKILLMAPSGDAGLDNCRKNLAKFSGEVYIAIGDKDDVVGTEAGKIFYDLVKAASKKELVIIPNCDHQFRGEINGKIMSVAPLWAFAQNKTFPSPDDGIVLY